MRALTRLVPLAAVLLIALITMTAGQADARTWAKKYSYFNSQGTPFPVYPREVLETRDGGIVLAGSPGGPLADVVKLDPFGNILWSRPILSTSSNGGLWGMVETSDGGIAVTGMFQEVAYGSERFSVVKLSADGVVQWHKYYSEPGATSQRPIGGIAEAPDGGLLLLGYHSGAGGADYWLIKTDANGDVLWQKRYGGPGLDWASAPGLGVIPQSVPQYGGNIVLAGYTDGWGAGSSSQDLWVLFLDSTGNILSQRTFGDAGTESPVAVTVASNGDVIVAARASSYPAGGTINTTWLLRFDPSGSLLWQRSYGYYGVSSFDPADVIELQNGNLAFVARTYCTFCPRHSILVELTSNGVPLSATEYSIAYDWAPYRLGQASDGGFLLAGTASYPESGLVIRTDSLGQVSSSCSLVSTSLPVGNVLVVDVTDTPFDTDGVAVTTTAPMSVLAPVSTDLPLGTEDQCGLAVTRIEAVPWRLDFGLVGTIQTATMPIEIRSTGELDLYVSAMDAPPPFGVATSCAGSTVPAGGSCVAEIEFNPPYVGAFAGELTVESDDPETPVLIVTLTGEGTNIIFEDDFESGDAAAWSATVP